MVATPPDPPAAGASPWPMVDAVREAIVGVAGSSLVGLYLLGSLATGDFEAGVSDLDLLAVLAGGPDERLVAALGRMHDHLARANPAWDDRIEVVYGSRQGLARCRTDPATIAVISSDAPFQVLEAGDDWVLTWYPAREDGVRLLGPPIEVLIPPIPWAEFVEAVRRSLAGLTERVPDDAPPRSQAFAILTACRALYAIRFGERRSKRAAAAWARRELPHRAGLIDRALGWRRRQWDPGRQDGSATVAETRSFVAELARLSLR